MSARRPVLPWLCALLWLGFIWGHSLQTAAVSSQESGAALSALSSVLAFLHLPPVFTEVVVRKLAHMTEYLVLAVLLAWGLEKPRRPLWLRLAALGGLCLTCAFLDETIQLFVPGRSGQVSDIWIDLGGGAAGALLWHLGRFLYALRAHRSRR